VARKTNRKSGIRSKRRRDAKRLWRDREIYRFLRAAAAIGRGWHANLREPLEPLSVYLGKPGHKYNKVLTQFPVRKQPNGRPMPGWNDLSPWLKMQLAVMLLDEWQFQTFNIDIHHDLEREWVKEGRDVRVAMRDRLRRELDKRVRPGLEHFFVIEGWSKRAKAQTKLHIHGAAAIYPDDPADPRKIMIAAGRAAGHGLQGYSRQRRAVHGRMFTRRGPAYINYLFKSVRRKDDRLNHRRVTMSRSVVRATRDFWEKDITGRVED
jgi:hypothetical protein